MKNLLVLIIVIETLLLGFLTGATYQLHKTTSKSDKCIRLVLANDILLQKYYGHKIDLEDTWVHAESAVASRYLRCIYRRDL